MAASFGLHFGNTSACVAVSNDGNVEVLANAAGLRVTPCMVAYTDHDQEVGAAAKQGLIRNSENTVCNVKQLIGRKYVDPEVTAYQKDHSVTVVEGDETLMFSVRYKEKTTLFSPCDIMTTIFMKMLETAQSRGGGSGTTDTVLTIPLDFSPEQKNIVILAAEKAGLNILRVISEPSAAVLAYDIAQTDIHEEGNVLVVRIGGTSTTVTVVRVLNGLYRVLSSVTTATGGRQFTQCIIDQLVAEFKRKHRCDVTDNQRAMAKLKMAAETCKHSLTRLSTAHVAVDSLYDGIDMDVNVSRMRFESSLGSLVQQYKDLIRRGITDARVKLEDDLTESDIYKVVLCGGGANVPVLQKAIADFLPAAQILSSIPPEEVIAIGATKEAAILASIEKEELKQHEQMTDIDCSSDPIFYSVTNCTDTPESGTVFHRHTPLPARKHRRHTLRPNCDQFSLILSLTEEATNEALTKLVLEDLPHKATINVTYHLRREGSLHVSCSEPTTNKEASVTIEATVGED